MSARIARRLSNNLAISTNTYEVQFIGGINNLLDVCLRYLDVLIAFVCFRIPSSSSDIDLCDIYIYPCLIFPWWFCSFTTII